MELKYIYKLWHEQGWLRFNRTFMELKFAFNFENTMLAYVLIVPLWN